LFGDNASVTLSGEINGKFFNTTGAVTMSDALEAKESIKKQGDEMTPDKWADKDRITRESIEAQVAFKGVVELLVSKIIEPTGELGMSAIDWALERLKVTTQEQLNKMPHVAEKAVSTSETSKSSGIEEEESTIPFKNIGEVLMRGTKLAKQLGVTFTSQELCDRLGVKMTAEIADLEAAWLEAKSIIEGKI